MIHPYEDLYLGADDNCYILGIPYMKKVKNKNDKVIVAQRMHNVIYHPSIE